MAEDADGNVPNGAPNRVDTSHVDGELYEKGEGAAFLQHEKNFLDPSRWWFASTAFPLLAGTFGPIASAFSICALSEDWRARLTDPPHHINQLHQIPITDPTWLIALNSVSLALAIIANASLLLNMTQRIPFSVAQPITVFGFFLASVFLCIMVGIAGRPSWPGLPEENFVLTEAYYYAAFAAGLYAIIAILMGVTVYGAFVGHTPKDFQLTKSQRTLMAQTIAFMAYLLIGAVIYKYVEGWYFLDAVYWADFTLLTVGIGDYYVPTTATGRGLLIPYAVGGIVALGLVVGSINSLVLEASSEKLGARTMERKREAVLRSLNYEKGHYYVDWYRKRKFTYDDPKLSEMEKRKQEFYAMRDLLERAERNRAWRGLSISLFAFCALWFCGAAIFMATESEQNWSYFNGLYFSYVILLTIGYGDLEAKSNAGRPFFVFWSLLAVPALTVLIGDLSETIVLEMSRLTNFLISLTFRPRQAIAKSTNKMTGRESSAPGKIVETDDGISATTSFGGTTDIILDHLMDPDIVHCERAGASHLPEYRDSRFYNFLLLREVRRVLVDCEADPPRQYTFEEWAYYLKLLGLDESNPEIHAKPLPPIVPEEKPDGSPETFNLARDIDDDGIVQPWSWLGVRSPLMSGKSEPQWILHRLIIRLQRELHLDNWEPETGREKEGLRDVPLSITLLRQETGTMPGIDVRKRNAGGGGAVNGFNKESLNENGQES